jgi:hypothetical protein
MIFKAKFTTPTLKRRDNAGPGLAREWSRGMGGIHSLASVPMPAALLELASLATFTWQAAATQHRANYQPLGDARQAAKDGSPDSTKRGTKFTRKR